MDVIDLTLSDEEDGVNNSDACDYEIRAGITEKDVHSNDSGSNQISDDECEYEIMPIMTEDHQHSSDSDGSDVEFIYETEVGLAKNDENAEDEPVEDESDQHSSKENERGPTDCNQNHLVKVVGDDTDDTDKSQQPSTCTDSFPEFDLTEYEQETSDKDDNSSETTSNFITNFEIIFYDPDDSAPTKPYRCRFCKFRCSSKSSRNSHTSVHTGMKLFKCDDCTCRFDRLAQLKKHRRKIHSTENVQSQCVDCSGNIQNKKPRNKNNGPKRKPNIIIPNRLPCGLCSSMFSSEPAFDIHLRTAHLGVSVYTCYTCMETFTNSHLFSCHKKSHDVDKLFFCKLCDLPFDRKGDMQEHLRRHPGSVLHRCKVCFAGFKHRGYVVKHMKTHHPGNPLT